MSSFSSLIVISFSIMYHLPTTDRDSIDTTRELKRAQVREVREQINEIIERTKKTETRRKRDHLLRMFLLAICGLVRVSWCLHVADFDPDGGYLFQFRILPLLYPQGAADLLFSENDAVNGWLIYRNLSRNSNVRICVESVRVRLREREYFFFFLRVVPSPPAFLSTFVLCSAYCFFSICCNTHRQFIFLKKTRVDCPSSLHSTGRSLKAAYTSLIESMSCGESETFLSFPVQTSFWVPLVAVRVCYCSASVKSNYPAFTFPCKVLLATEVSIKKTTPHGRNRNRFMIR
jgi:hypothetical protein